MTKTSPETKSQLSEGNRNELFDNLLSLEDRKYLLKHGQMHEVDIGSLICHKDQTSDDLFMILQGEVEITGSEDTNSKALGKLGAGELFGEISALFSVPRIASVVAIKPSIILQLRKDDFIELLERSPDLKDMVYKRLSQRMLKTTTQTQ